MSLQSQIDILALGLCNVHKALNNKGDPVGGFCITDDNGAAYYIDSKGRIFEEGTEVESGIEIKGTENKVRLIMDDGQYTDSDKMIDFEFKYDIIRYRFL